MLGLSASTSAAIRFQDLSPDILVQSEGSDAIYPLDLDNDGTPDFHIRSSIAFDPPFNQLYITPLGAVGHAVAAPGGSSFCCEPFGDPLVYNLPGGAPIDEGLSWSLSTADLNCDACGNWALGETGYVALRLQDGLAARYGWLRLTRTGESGALLLDYAVELLPGVDILAGNTGTCNAPSNRVGESLDNSKALLSWEPVTGAFQYQVSWRKASGGPLTQTITAANSINLVGLLPDTRYRWSVASMCFSDTSAPSAAIEFGTSGMPRPGQVQTLDNSVTGFPAAEPDGIINFAGFGDELAAIGDLNGDGRMDLAVGTRYLPLGANGGLRIVWPDGAGGVLQVRRPVHGPEDIYSMTGLGDVDGNGAGDVAITEDLTDLVWILRLLPDGNSLSAHVLQWTGADVTGGELASIGDWDNNGVQDLMVRQTGGIELYLLDSSGLAIARHFIDFTGTGIGGGFFEGLAGIGDIDNDGVLDIAVGNGLDNQDAPNAGAVFVALLNSDASVKSVRKLNGTNSGNWISNQNSDLFGRTLCGTGDLSGDGIPDLAVAAEQDDDPFSQTGSILLIALNTDGSLLSSRKLADRSQGLNLGLSEDDQLGLSLVWIGDTNGDGIGELAAGAPGFDGSGNNLGAVHLFGLGSAPCATPQDAVVDMLSATAVRLVWSPLALADGYFIEGRKVGGAPQTAFRTGTSFVRIGLQPNRSYAWRIRAQCGEQFSAWTAMDTFTTPVLRNAAGTPALLYPNPTSGRVVLEFEDDTQRTVAIFDATGRRVFQQQLNGAGPFELYLHDLSDGVYRLCSDNGDCQPIVLMR